MGSKPKYKEIFNLVDFLQLTPSEVKIYKRLFSKPMTINDLKKLRISERMIRNDIKMMLKKGFVQRSSVIKNSRLQYVYIAALPLITLKLIRDVAVNADKLMTSYTDKMLKEAKKHISKIK
ncbi:MAG: hypothetical protein HYW24_04925 [Candidatus Aenigmarchaeota archaeon]|nr:hypothetical protein [Candidatus Aenigmarchaeota archaeon]